MLNMKSFPTGGCMAVKIRNANRSPVIRHSGILALFVLTSIVSVPFLFAGQSEQAVSSAVSETRGPIEFARDKEQLVSRYSEAREKFEADIRKLSELPAAERNFDNTIKALDTATNVLSDSVQPLILMAYTSSDPEIRAGAQKIEEDFGKYNVNLWSREDLYKAVTEYVVKKEPLKTEEQRLLELILRNFNSIGMQLPEEKRALLIKKQERLAELESQFLGNINAYKDSLEVSIEDLKGLPESYINGLQSTLDGKRIVTLKYPDYEPFMKYAENAGLRKQLELKYNNRAVQNVPLLQEALRLRDDSAKLLGYESFAQWKLAPRMAKEPEKVWTFLNGLLPMLRESAGKELQELLELKKRDDPTAEQLNSWEVSYYSEKLRKALYNLDSEEVRQYFPMDVVVEGTMKVYQKVLGLKFAEIASPEAWHEDVRLFQVNDADTNRRLGFFYLDLYPRDGKYTHAAVFPLIQGRDLAGKSYNEPAAAMVANFSKPAGNTPGLLYQGEVETFFHEFGHIMHNVLTRAPYGSLSGASVAHDFVEAPSQMMENFVLEREVLDEVSGHWQDHSRKIPDELYQKMLKARGFNKGIRYARQAGLAITDMLYHTAVPANTTVLFNQIMEMTGLVPVQSGTHYEAAFGHLMGGYGAGYYAYLWSEVFADDIFSRFKKEGVFNPEVGADYRREILEQGSSRPEEESLRKFLKREPNSDAFKKKLAPDPKKPNS